MNKYNALKKSAEAARALSVNMIIPPSQVLALLDDLEAAESELKDFRLLDKKERDLKRSFR